MGKLKNIPVSEQPYEKCRNKGVESLTDSELLAVFIRTGTRDKDPIEIARNIINQSPSGELVGLMQMSYKNFSAIKGIGEVKAIQLLCLGELSKRISRQHALSTLKLDNPDSVACYYMEKLRHIKQEQVWVCLFDTKCNLLNDRMLSSGTVNASLISPREILMYALEHKAVYMIMVHNHPSGDPTPSEEDKQLTRRVADAGDIINIKLIDHIIIGDCNYTSLKKIGMIN